MRIKPSYPRVNPSHPLAPGLVLALTFHEGSGVPGDLGPSRYAATVLGNPAWTPGDDGPAYEGDGSGDGLDFGSASAAGGEGGITVAAVVTPDQVASDMAIVSRGPILNSMSYNLWLDAAATIRGSTNTYSFGVSDGSSALSRAEGTSGLAVAGRRAVIAGTWRPPSAPGGQQIRLFLDGRLVGQDTQVNAGATAGVLGHPLRAGISGAGSVSWDGRISGVLIWDRILSSAEVAELSADFFAVARQSAPLVVSSAATALLPGTATATAVGHDAVDLEGTAATGGRPPYAYQWERADDPQGEWSDLAGLDSLEEQDAGLDDGTTYWYRLRVEDANGTQAWSAPASATTEEVDPDAATAYTLTGPSSMPIGSSRTLRLQANGSTAAEVTLTPSAGSITPNPVQLDGTNEVTATLSGLDSAGTVTVSAADDAGLTDPDDLSIEVVEPPGGARLGLGIGLGLGLGMGA